MVAAQELPQTKNNEEERENHESEYGEDEQQSGHFGEKGKKSR